MQKAYVAFNESICVNPLQTLELSFDLLDLPTFYFTGFITNYGNFHTTSFIVYLLHNISRKLSVNLDNKIGMHTFLYQ